ncbi:MAG: lysophospholipid acyltransferase family protein [Alphaproteobacteria bacterium]|nr:lysophospholipid acyltransferase family protein [Alphaproteobacteria bacterium]
MIHLVRLKHLFQKRWFQKMLAAVIAAYILLLRYTSRWQSEHEFNATQFWQSDQPVILTLWHGRLSLIPYLAPNDVHVTVLTSNHKDGRIIAYTLELFGHKTVQGSSTQGGATGVRKMLADAKNGCSLLITPDAPPQKAYTCAKGVAELARLSGLPIIPCAVSTTRGKQLNTKDRFVLPYPFTTFVLRYGEPLMIDRKASKEERIAFLMQIETSLQTLTQEVDDAVGHKEWSA